MKKAIILIIWGTLAIWNAAVSPDANAAPESPKEQAGEPCDTKTFNSICSGDKLVLCVKNMVKVIDCTENGNKEKTCVEFKDSKMARCISKDEMCTVENEFIKKEIKLSSEKTIQKKYKCEKTSNGKLYFHEMNNKTNAQNETNLTNSTESNNKDSRESTQTEDWYKCSQENDIAIRTSTLNSGNNEKDYYRCERGPDGKLAFRKLTKAETENYVSKRIQTSNNDRVSKTNSFNIGDDINDRNNAINQLFKDSFKE
ncbi:MAG: hypothetical protein J6A01_02285, partial [Proteobacteria bacterium]|nr:hypothetical protein [Pseudomonadota bacterium]